MAQALAPTRVKNTISRIVKEHTLDDPFIVIDMVEILERAICFKSCAEKHFKKVEIAYSYKTNNLSSLCNALTQKGFSAEVVSLDEMHCAIADGYFFDKILFNGPYKKRSELEFAIFHNVRIQVDNIFELEKIYDICKKSNKTAQISLRLSHPYRSAQSRFGLNKQELETVLNNKKYTKNNHVDFKGFHLHSGSNLRDTANIENTLSEYANIILRHMPEDGWLDLGSGFPADSFSSDPHQPTPTVDSFMRNLKTVLQRLFKIAYEHWKIIFEPGRCLVEDCGYFLTKIVSSKKRFDTTILQSNIGINWVPSVHNWAHAIEPITPNTTLPPNKQVISGINCFESDYICFDFDKAKIDIGDYLLVRGCGAYDLQTSNIWTRGGVRIYSIFSHGYVLSRTNQKIESLRTRDVPTLNSKIVISQSLHLFEANQIYYKELHDLIIQNKIYLSEFLDWPKFINTETDTLEFLAGAAIQHKKSSSKTFIIFYNNQCTGVISFNTIDRHNKTAEIGYWISQNNEKKGIVSSALKHLIEKYSKDNYIMRFVIKCSTTNIKSNHVAKRNGFKLEGKLLKAEKINDIFYDQHIYSKTMHP